MKHHEAAWQLKKQRVAVNLWHLEVATVAAAAVVDFVSVCANI